MEQENIFIMQVCNFLHPDAGKLEELLSKPLDYPYILGQLLFNRMGGVAYYTLQQTNLLHKCNREFKNPLRIIYESAMVQSKSFSAALNALSALLKNVSFSYAVLKGGYLNNLYPKGLRTSNDIDSYAAPYVGMFSNVNVPPINEEIYTQQLVNTLDTAYGVGTYSYRIADKMLTYEDNIIQFTMFVEITLSDGNSTANLYSYPIY